jgi:hypothetical protein
MTSAMTRHDSDDLRQDDPELAALAARLRETASYAITPAFMEKLRKKLMLQFADWTSASKPISTHEVMQ